MSKCISVHGEYSEHTFTHNPECDCCGEPSPNPSEAMKSALEQIQELHAKTYWTAQDEVWELNAKCNECHAAYPCKTRKLADAGLAGGERG